jgi:hypothetical protein
MMITATTQTVLLACLFLLFCKTESVAQTEVDSLFYKMAVNNAVAVYQKTVKEQSRLLNGIQYASFPPTTKEGGHPFFDSPTLRKGSILYDKVVYDDILLLYDEVAGVLVYQDSLHRLQLHKELVSQFSISDNHFIRLMRDSLKTNLLNTGFYQVLYDGKTRVLKQEIKTVSDDIVSIAVGVVRSFKAKTTYFIQKNKTYYAVKKENDVLDAFKDRESEVRQFIKNQKLSFKDKGDVFLLKVAVFYDQLIGQ